jgi:DNA-binding transcriptional ArsR family regulator
MNNFNGKATRSVPAKPPRAAVVWIKLPAQIRALESPSRQEIIDALGALGPSSIGELAEYLGRAPDSLYFHVKKLVKVRLVQELEQRSQGRHEWTIYALSGRSARIVYDPKLRTSIQRIVAGALRLSLREFQQATVQRGVRLRGARRNVWGGRTKGWLGAGDLAEVNRLLEQLTQIMCRNGPGEGRSVHSLAWVLSPAQMRARPKQQKKPSITRNGS